MDELTGTVERITYYNPENGYSVLRLRPELKSCGEKCYNRITKTVR